MNCRIPILALAVLASPLPLQGQPSQDGLARAHAAAIQALHPNDSTPLLIVQAEQADTMLAYRAAERLGSGTRVLGVTASRTCHGDIFPQCAWETTGDTVAVRVRTERSAPASLTVLVDLWGRLQSPNARGPSGFYTQYRVALERRGDVWVVTTVTPMWSS